MRLTCVVLVRMPVSVSTCLRIQLPTISAVRGKGQSSQLLRRDGTAKCSRDDGRYYLPSSSRWLMSDKAAMQLSHPVIDYASPTCGLLGHRGGH